MKIAISGASGSVARSLIPLLAQAGHTLLLISRDPEKVKRQFPGLAVASAKTWEQGARDYEIFLHLAVMNNNVAGTLREFMETNVSVTAAVAAAARRARISRFIYPSTVQALISKSRSPYVLSKAVALEAARESFGGPVEVVYLGLVHGDFYSGKLSLLNQLPQSFAAVVFPLLSALKPTTSIQELVRYLGLPKPAGTHPSLILTDKKSGNSTYQVWQASLSGIFVLAVLLLIPLLFLIWGVVVIEGGRPGIFIQERKGFGDTVFRCVKFRTMQNGTESKSTHMVESAAVTKVGRVLRRLKADELPQAWNVLRGEMVLVGPRPCLPSQQEVVAARNSRDVTNYRPGLTGWAQVSGVDMRDPDLLADYDAQYLGLQSVWFDLRIIRGTFFATEPPQIP